MVTREHATQSLSEAPTEGIRQAILDVARREIVEHGCSGASVRNIARAADVDPRLVRYYYESRENLLCSALSVGGDPLELATRLLRHNRSTIGRRTARATLLQWEAVDSSNLYRARLTASLESPDAAERLQSEFVGQFLGTIAASVSPDRPRLRATLAASHLTGVGVCRYVVDGNPMAQMDIGAVIRVTGVVLQRLLTGPLP